MRTEKKKLRHRPYRSSNAALPHHTKSKLDADDSLGEGVAAYADTHPLVTDGCVVVVARHTSVASTLPAAGHPVKVKPFFYEGRLKATCSSSPRRRRRARPPLHCHAMPCQYHATVPLHTIPAQARRHACWPGVNGADRAETAASACMGIDPTSRPLLCMQMRQSMVSLTVT